MISILKIYIFLFRFNFAKRDSHFAKCWKILCWLIMTHLHYVTVKSLSWPWIRLKAAIVQRVTCHFYVIVQRMSWFTFKWLYDTKFLPAFNQAFVLLWIDPIKKQKCMNREISHCLLQPTRSCNMLVNKQYTHIYKEEVKMKNFGVRNNIYIRID